MRNVSIVMSLAARERQKTEDIMSPATSNQLSSRQPTTGLAARGAAALGVALCAWMLLLSSQPVGIRAAEDDPMDLRKADKTLKKAIGTNDLGALSEICTALRRNGGKDSIALVLKYAAKIPAGADAPYWRLVRTAALFADAPALEHLGTVILKQKKSTFARDLVFSLQDNINPTVVPVLARILDKAPIDLKLLAVDRLAAVKVVESVDALIASLKREEKKGGRLVDRLQRSLRALTGADMGEAENWEKWWSIERSNGLNRPDSERGGTGTVTDDLDPTRHSELDELKNLDNVLVLKASECRAGMDTCNYDHIENMLGQMEIKHKVATKEDFNKGIVSLKGIVAVLINCTQTKEHCICPKCTPGGANNMRMKQCTGCDVHDLVSHQLTGASVKVLKEYVERGGFIFSEDWVLSELHAKAWPKLVGVGKYLKEQEVDTFPARGATSHPYMRGVFRNPAPPVPQGGAGEGGTVVDPPSYGGSESGNNHSWKVDNESPAVKVNDRRSVRVLLTSKKLAAEANGNDAVAITFLPVGSKSGGRRRATTGGAGDKAPDPNAGRVLHVMSHFGKQNSQDDEFALQNLLINFLIEATARSR